MLAGTPVKAKEEDFLLETMVLALLLAVTGKRSPWKSRRSTLQG